MGKTHQKTEYVLNTVSYIDGSQHTATYDSLKEATKDLNSSVKKFRAHFDNGGTGWGGKEFETEGELDAFIDFFFYIDRIVTKSERAMGAPARTKYERRIEKVAEGGNESDAQIIEANLDREATGAVYQLEQYAQTLRWHGDSEGARKVSDKCDKLLEKLSSDHVLRRYYDGRNLRWLVFPATFANRGVEITCYRHTETWLSRSNAMSFYAEGIQCCEGSERDRYVQIFMELGNGLDHCTDERW